MITFSRTRSAIFEITPPSPPFFTPYGESPDDDGALAAARLLDVRAGTHHDPAAARAVRVADARAPDDDASGREIRASDVLHEILDARGRLVDERDNGVDRLREIVGRDVRGHADCDARRAVDERFGKRDGKTCGSPATRRSSREVDGVGVDVPEHLRRERGEAALGVPLGGRRVVVDRAEVA